VTHLEGAGKPWVGALALLRTVRSYHLLMGKTAGPVRARLLDAALAVVFALRALAFAALAPLAHSQRTRSVRRDKSVAFKRAAAVAGQAALTGRVPPLC
jgi:hypothetical protein